MKKLILFLVIFVPYLCFSQDLILLKNGERIECKITRIDSSSVYYDFHKDERTLSGQVAITEIRSYQAESANEGFDPNDNYLPPAEDVLPVAQKRKSVEINRWVNMVTYSQRFGLNAHGWSFQYYGYISRSTSRWRFPVVVDLERFAMTTNYFAQTGYNKAELKYYSAGVSPLYKLNNVLYFNLGGTIVLGEETISKYSEGTTTRIFFGVAPSQGFYFISKSRFGITLGISAYEKLLTSKVYKSDLGVKLELGIKF